MEVVLQNIFEDTVPVPPYLLRSTTVAKLRERNLEHNGLSSQLHLFANNLHQPYTTFKLVTSDYNAMTVLVISMLSNFRLFSKHWSAFNTVFKSVGKFS